MKRLLFPALLLALLCPLHALAADAPVAPTGDPGTLWVVALDGGRTLEAARLTGAAIRDAFPEALVVSERQAAETLATAGFRVTGPLEPTAGRTIYLARERGRRGLAPAIAPAALESIAALGGVRVLWAEGPCLVVEVDGALPLAEPLLGLSPKVLRAATIDAPRVSAPPHAATTTTFPPAVDALVAQVTPAAYIDWIGKLAGASAVMVGGSPHVFTTRYTKSTQCDMAEQYVYEQFQAMGYTDVAYDPFVVQGYDARNVIATLPGTETPEHIYILCGHLDSVSPDAWNLAPGANDNASGTAAVLLAADIMKDQEFRSTIKFIAFTGEEQGLYGSEHYAAQAAAAGDQIMGVVNCDMIAWWSQQYRIDIEGGTAWEWLMQTMNDACSEYTALSTHLTYFSWGSDHVPFQQNGFPAFLAIETEYDLYPCYHQTCDVTENNDEFMGADVTRASLATIAYLAEPVTSTGIETAGSAPATLRLDGNRPNPFNPFTTVTFSLPAARRAELAIYDTAGRLVRTLVQGELAAGEHAVSWDGTALDGAPMPSGVYFYALSAGDASVTRKMTLAR